MIETNSVVLNSLLTYIRDYYCIYINRSEVYKVFVGQILNFYFGGCLDLKIMSYDVMDLDSASSNIS